RDNANQKVRPIRALALSSVGRSALRTIQLHSYWGHRMDINEPVARNGEMLIELTADVVAAYVSNNPVPVGELPNLIADVHAALGRVGNAPEQAPVDKQKPAVNPKKSIHDDYLICLE